MPTTTEWLKSWQSTSSDHESLLAYLEVLLTRHIIFTRPVMESLPSPLQKGCYYLKNHLS